MKKDADKSLGNSREHKFIGIPVALSDLVSDKLQLFMSWKPASNTPIANWLEYSLYDRALAATLRRSRFVAIELVCSS